MHDAFQHQKTRCMRWTIWDGKMVDGGRMSCGSFMRQKENNIKEMNIPWALKSSFSFSSSTTSCLDAQHPNLMASHALLCSIPCILPNSIFSVLQTRQLAIHHPKPEQIDWREQTRKFSLALKTGQKPTKANKKKSRKQEKRRQVEE